MGGGWKLLQLGAWIAFFGMMVFRDAPAYYLAGVQIRIFQVGFFLLLLVFAAEAGTLLRTRRGFWGEGAPTAARVVETLGHGIPLLLFLLVGTASLTFSGGSGAGAGNAAIKIFRPPDAASRPDLTTLEPGTYLPVTQIDLTGDDYYDGEAPVELVGRVYRFSVEERDAFPAPEGGTAPEWVLYRYAMACCAADSSPVSVVLEGFSPEGAAQHQWLRVRGRAGVFREAPKLPRVRVASWEAIPEPAAPYLSWLQSTP